MLKKLLVGIVMTTSLFGQEGSSTFLNTQLFTSVTSHDIKMIDLLVDYLLDLIVERTDRNLNSISKHHLD